MVKRIKRVQVDCFLVGAVKVGGVLGCYPYSESRNFLLLSILQVVSNGMFWSFSFTLTK